MDLFFPSPFKPNRLETDPMVFGLRETVIKESIFELFNNKSLLLTGLRGIGKSSFGYQLQNILAGDNRLLIRCGINLVLPHYITIDYTCNNFDSIVSIIKHICSELDIKTEEMEPKHYIKKTELNFSLLKFVEAKIEIAKEDDEKNTSLLKAFLDAVLKYNDIYEVPRINIFIDELDQLNSEYNIAQFIKSALENLNRRNFNGISFILAGQSSLLKSLIKQQPAFTRLVKHINLKPLNEENSENALLSLLQNSVINIEIEDKAKYLLLDLACGYPHTLQLLGHHSFCDMLNNYIKEQTVYYIRNVNVLHALRDIIISYSDDYLIQLESLSEHEIKILYLLASSNRIDNQVRIQMNREQIEKEMQKTDIEYSELCFGLQSLIEKQILVENKDDDIINSIIKFKDELFRIYITWRINYKTPFDYDAFSLL